VDSPALDHTLQNKLFRMDQESLESIMLGACTLQHPPANAPEIYQSTYSTSMEQSNLVGNVYYSNYTYWQLATVDAFVRRCAPELYQQSSGAELTCLRYSVDHSAELMPFDQVKVRLA
jgi:hypothetical protein